MKVKDQIKIYFFPKLLQLLNAIGFSWKALGKLTFFNKSIMLAQAPKLANFDIDHTEAKQNIFVLTMLPGSTFHLYIEALLALGLKKKGHKITFLLDDNFLPIHELMKFGQEKEWEKRSRTDYIYASKFLEAMNLDFISLSEFVGSKDQLQYDDQFDHILEASLLKHYKVGFVTSDLPHVEERKLQVKESIAITDFVGRKLQDINPDMVLMNHGIYSTWGPPFDRLFEKNIPILIHSTAKKKNSQVFNWNKTGNTWDITEQWDREKNKKLTKDELKDINKYLDSRILHKDDIYVYNFGDKTSDEETINFLGLDPSKPIYTLFTNVLWDAASAQREIAFENPIKWVIETIAWFNNHPDKQLIVKIHPAEVIIGTKMPFYDIILSRVTPKENVKIIKPEVTINSWSIYNITDLGLVHTTTAGMELPLVDKPCIVVSKTHYRGKGFTIDVNSKEEYFKVIQDFESLQFDLDKNKELALKYAHLLFLRFQIPFSMFNENVTMDVRGFKYEKIEDYFNDDIYVSLIQKIESREPIFL